MTKYVHIKVLYTDTNKTTKIINHIDNFKYKHELKTYKKLFGLMGVPAQYFTKLRNEGRISRKDLKAIGDFIGVDLFEYVDWDLTKKKHNEKCLKLQKIANGTYKEKDGGGTPTAMVGKMVGKQCPRCRKKFNISKVMDDMTDRKLCNNCLAHFEKIKTRGF